MSVTIGGTTPQLTFADATVQNTAALPLTGGSVSADITVHGLTVGQGSGSVSTNTAVGASALAGSNTGANNTAVGYQAGYSNTGGAQNVFVGLNARYYGTTGTDNTAIGVSSMQGSSGTTTGSYNIGIGSYALFSNTTASNNTAIGYQAGYTYYGPDGYNTLFGWKAGYALTTGYTNTIIGANAGTILTTGSYSTFVGVGAGNQITTGTKNTIIGAFSGNQGGLNITASNNFIVLSDGDGNPRLINDGSNHWAIGKAPSNWGSSYTVMEVNSGAIYGSGSELSMAGNTYFNGASWVAKSTNGASLTVNGATIATYTAASVTAGSNYSLIAGPYVANTGTSWTNSSDERLKNVTGEIQDGLSKVCSLRAAEFSWKSDLTNKPCVGLIAQDVQKVLPEVVNSSAYVIDDETEYLGVSYTETIPLLVAAIKELSAQVTTLQAQVTALQAKVGV
jgi:hypothetical protein